MSDEGCDRCGGTLALLTHHLCQDCFEELAQCPPAPVDNRLPPRVKCRGCGREIMFLRIETPGRPPRRMPVDARELCYRALPGGGGVAVSDVFVNHWATCKNAAEFRPQKGSVK